MSETTPTPRDTTARPAQAPNGAPDRAAERRARLWAVLHDDSAPQAAFFSAWLALQCEALPGATGGLLLLRTAEGGTHPQAVWPDRRDPADLARLAERALAEARTIAAWGRTQIQGAVALFVAQPLGPDAAHNAVVAVALTVPGGIDRADPDAIGRQLRAASGWIDAWRWRQPLEAARARIAIAATGLDILAATGEHRGLAASSMALVNTLATRLSCDRAALGLARRHGVALQAVSHAAEFQKGSRIADAMADAMDEALTQNTTLALPEPPEGSPDHGPRRVTVAHRALHVAAGTRGGVASVVLPGPGGSPVAVLTLERHASAFTADELRLAETVAALTGPVIGLHAAERRWISGRARDLLEDGLRALFGPARPALKLAAALVLALVATLALVEGEYRVSARAVVEGEVQRAAVAPFDGFIRSAPVRAGDTVKQGDTLATLDDRDLVLDRLKWIAEREKLAQKHREALAKGERAALAVLAAQLAQADAELSLAEEKLARSRIAAPFDAVVVSGDLRQMLGSPIERGKVLFELAPLDAWRLVVQADEREVRWLAAGQRGLLALASQPSARLPVRVERVTPVAVAEDGRNFFRVEAKVESQDAAALRPGMEGIAKIETGPQRLLWIWTHSILDWLRLFAWQWLP